MVNSVLDPKVRIPIGLMLLALIAPLPALATTKSLGARISHQRIRVGDWQLDMSRNGFTGSIVCSLHARDRRAVYRAEAVGFRFKPRWNVNDAIYRLDNGAPRAFRDDLPKLIAQDVPLDRGGMDNATSGFVWVPYKRLAEANAVAIQPTPSGRVAIFHFRGLVPLHDIAVSRGCTPESRFVGP